MDSLTNKKIKDYIKDAVLGGYHNYIIVDSVVRDYGISADDARKYIHEAKSEIKEDEALDDDETKRAVYVNMLKRSLRNAEIENDYKTASNIVSQIVDIEGVKQPKKTELKIEHFHPVEDSRKAYEDMLLNLNILQEAIDNSEEEEVVHAGIEQDNSL